MTYNPKEIEKKWQDKWQNDGSFEPSSDFSKPKKIYFKYVSLS